MKASVARNIFGRTFIQWEIPLASRSPVYMRADRADEHLVVCVDAAKIVALWREYPLHAYRGDNSAEPRLRDKDAKADNGFSHGASNPVPLARVVCNSFIDRQVRYERHYNSAILSRLLTKYEAAGNAKVLELITRISPAAWRHILLNGHYTFQSDGRMIDLDVLVAGLELE